MKFLPRISVLQLEELMPFTIDSDTNSLQIFTKRNWSVSSTEGSRVVRQRDRVATNRDRDRSDGVGLVAVE